MPLAIDLRVYDVQHYNPPECRILRHPFDIVQVTHAYDATQEVPFEMDLCNLLQTMKLEGSQAEKGSAKISKFRATKRPRRSHGRGELSHGGSDCSSSSSGSSASNTVSKEAAFANTIPLAETHEVFGCAYLQAVCSQLDNYPTTSGEYLEAIFIHREILSSFPGAHRDCARAFTDLAYRIEQRAWRADRDADLDAVTAFRNEAWMIASTM
ncbi:hypothetical protein D9756_005482 [Leucocoprinus leucothites]|uniref:Uncharacterized protein n=1 Tax=Leucocoprinus leucothites TaxID=201217 RepID=A0A8H5D898_9AGAR|nr:hypothetical protein D9756_005482 [Leucoagaricus leucothites]